MSHSTGDTPERPKTHRVEGTPAPEVGEPEVGQEIDDFLLVDELGEGAFAKVFLAHQKSLHRTVALKISAGESAEAETLAQLDHPNIVRVYDQRSLPDRDLRLLYMEYVPAGTLEAVIERVRDTPAAERTGRIVLEVVDEALEKRGEEPPLDSMLRARLDEATWPEAVCMLGAQLAIALDYAHSRRVLHRDVKPANVLLAASGRAKLADFNISYSAELDVASAGEYMGGSLPYMSPEQLEAVSPFHGREAESLDARSDVYGLAVVLWELLAGTHPFPDPPEGLGWKELFEHLVTSRGQGVPRETIEDLPADVPSMLVETLTACLAQDPDPRPQSGAELARRLELCLDPRLRILFSESGPRWLRFSRRFPILALLVVALVPNVLLSALNIFYNLNVVVEQEHQEQFTRQVQVVNGVLFPVGIAILLWFAWPVIAALRARLRAETTPHDGRSAVRLRAVRLGGIVTAVILPLWIIGGLVFPVWRNMQEGKPSEDAYFHFTTSNAMFGILAATLCFFLVHALTTRSMLPRLIVPGDVDGRCVKSMSRLRRRLIFYFAGCVAVPFASIMLLATRREGLDEKMRLTWIVLGALGAIAFALSLALSRSIQRDLEAIEGALAVRADRFRPLI